MATLPLPFKLRQLNRSDESFVYSSWLKLYRVASQYTKNIPKQLYFDNHKAIVRRSIESAGVKVVACDTEDDGVIYGYLIGDKAKPTALHFLYVKSSFREFGIGRKLLAALTPELNGLHLTHWTYYTEDYQRKNGGLIYDPYRI